MVGTCSRLLGRKMGRCVLKMARAPAMAPSMPFPLSPYAHVRDLHEEGNWYVPLIIGLAIFGGFCLLMYVLWRSSRPPATA